MEKTPNCGKERFWTSPTFCRIVGPQEPCPPETILYSYVAMSTGQELVTIFKF